MGNPNTLHTLFNPLATHTISQNDQTESHQQLGRRQASLDITPWGAGDAKRQDDIYATRAIKTVSTAKPPTRLALALAKQSSSEIDRVDIRVGERQVYEESQQHQSQIHVDQ